jgi:anti-sigma factor RsiW
MSDCELTDIQIDRLVDGELPAAEYKQLLQQLDKHPHEWRRIGLAFLEAQAWRGEFSAAIAPPAPAVIHPPQKTRQQKAAWFITAAAVVFLACTGGWLLRGQPEQPLAKVITPVENPDQQPSNPPQLVRKPVTAASMQLKWNGGEVEVPIYERDSVDLNKLWTTSATQADEYVAAAERNGQQVVREWELIPIELQDGREAIVPVESIKPVPTNLVTY